ncbi:glycosyltransferase family 4 protein [Sphingobacterium faecium]|uniref:glycosyltransferase family 4 protein n=1 Tax=Sphingobacterium faecium TaxID=34087 RepID=UPI00320AA46B
MTKLIRITTVPISLKVLLKGQHRFMSSKGFNVLGVAAPGKDLDEVSQFEEIQVHPLAMTRTISPFADLMSLWNFYNLCKKHKPNIVHSHTPKAGIIGMLGAKLAGVPIRLHTVAGMPLMEATGMKRKVLDFVEKLTYRAATKVYPNSRGLYDFILDNNFTQKDKLSVLANGSSNGIDTTFFSQAHFTESDNQNLRQSLGIDETDFLFIFVGRLVGDKGLNELITAFVNLSKSMTYSNHVKLLLVGPFESELDPLNQKTLVEIKNNLNIISVGFQKDIRPYMAISDALVFPSYREGFPNVVMQAGAMGLPSIVSDINGCNEIIIEGKNGTIIPVKSAVAIQTAMMRFIDDISFFNQLKLNARTMIADRYEQHVVWQAILKEYHALLEEKGIVYV